MRTLKKIIYFLIIFIIGYWLYLKISPEFVKWTTLPVPQTAKFTDSDISIAYPVYSNKWLSFSVNKKLDYIKITTNAQFINAPDENIEYALNYEILDDSNNVIYKNVYYINSQKKIYRKAYSKRVMSNPYMIQGHYFLSPSQSFIIPLFDQKSNLSRIRFSRKMIGKADKNVEGILIRVSVPKSIVPGKSNILWLRLPEEKKNELAQPNFYPLSMLSKTEKENLISNLTSYIAPANKKVEMIRIAHAPYKSLHPKKLTGVKVDRKPKKFTSELYTLYRNSAGGHYKTVSKSSIEKAENLFIKLFRGASAEELKDDWSKLGMNIVEVKKGKRLFTVVYEKPNMKMGKGFYVFCKCKFMRNIVLEMPHRFFDKGTGLIGFKLMLSGYYSAGAWNTVFRYQTPNYIPQTSDMAHNIDKSFFSAFTSAFCKAMPDESMLIQLHGYSTEGKTDKKVSGSKIVVSEATKTPGKRFLFYADRLKARMPSPLYIYPEVEDIDELAALDNASALILRHFPKKHLMFLHFEMNQDIRKQMIKDFELRRQFSIAVKAQMKHIYNDIYGKPVKKDE